MIKINLALKKQSVAVASTDGAINKKNSFNLNALKNLFKKSADSTGGASSALKGLPIIPGVLGALIAFGAQYYFEEEKSKELEAASAQLAQVVTKKQSILKETAKYKDFEQKKNAIEADIRVVNDKIAAIQSLVQGRGNTFEILVGVSEAIPQKVWLNGFKFNQTDVAFEGGADDYPAVTDFWKNLSGLPFLSDVVLKETRQMQKSQKSSSQVASFNLSGRRK